MTITLTTSNPAVNTANPKQAAVICYLEYARDTNNYPWRVSFDKITLHDINRMLQRIRTKRHTDIDAIRKAADKFLNEKTEETEITIDE